MLIFEIVELNMGLLLEKKTFTNKNVFTGKMDGDTDVVCSENLQAHSSPNVCRQYQALVIFLETLVVLY